MKIVRLCLLGQSPEKKSQLVSIKNPTKCTPNELMKLAASKVHVKITTKKNSKKKKGNKKLDDSSRNNSTDENSSNQTWRLVSIRQNGRVIETNQDILDLEPMEYLVLVRPGEEYSDGSDNSNNNGEANTTSLTTTTTEEESSVLEIPKELWPLIWSFVPIQLEDYQLLRLARVCKEWSKIIPTKFQPHPMKSDIYGIGKGDTIRYMGLGQWFWYAGATTHNNHNHNHNNNKGGGAKAGTGWVRYSEETRLILEDAYGKGASVAMVEIREFQDLQQRKGNKKPRKQIKRIDFETMEQQNPGGARKSKGRIFPILRLPRIGCGVV